MTRSCCRVADRRADVLVRGFRHVTAAYGIEGFTAEHWPRRSPATGSPGADRLRPRRRRRQGRGHPGRPLLEDGVECFRVVPAGRRGRQRRRDRRRIRPTRWAGCCAPRAGWAPARRPRPPSRHRRLLGTVSAGAAGGLSAAAGLDERNVEPPVTGRFLSRRGRGAGGAGGAGGGLTRAAGAAGEVGGPQVSEREVLLPSTIAVGGSAAWPGPAFELLRVNWVSVPDARPQAAAGSVPRRHPGPLLRPGPRGVSGRGGGGARPGRGSREPGPGPGAAGLRGSRRGGGPAGAEPRRAEGRR